MSIWPTELFSDLYTSKRAHEPWNKILRQIIVGHSSDIRWLSKNSLENGHREKDDEIKVKHFVRMHQAIPRYEFLFYCSPILLPYSACSTNLAGTCKPSAEEIMQQLLSTFPNTHSNIFYICFCLAYSKPSFAKFIKTPWLVQESFSIVAQQFGERHTKVDVFLYNKCK